VTDQEILVGITEVAAEHLEWTGPLTPEMLLAEDLELDSIKTLMLAVEVENRFEICLDPEREQQIVTVGDLVGEVRRKLER
jgi:acyl carrier protein